jgi:glycosyltransferase involved in cell wall biosynthesis
LRAAIVSRNLRGKTGVSAIVLEHIVQLHKRGYDVDVVGQKLDNKLIKGSGGTPVKIPQLPAFRYLGRRYFSYRFSKITDKRNYDLIIGNSDILNQDVLFVHNLTHLERDTVPEKPSAGLLAKLRFDEDLFAKKNFSLCIANSNLTRNELIERHHVNPEIIKVAYPGFDPHIFFAQDLDKDHSELRRKLCDEDEFLIGFITSGHFAKRGADILLETIAALNPADLKRIKVLAVGSKNNIELLKTQFAAEGLADKLVTRGKTNNVAACYQAIDLLFHPARIEEFGLVVIEAAACGTAVLASRKVGAMEIFAAVGDDVLAESKANEFTKRLTSLINNPEELDAIAKIQWQTAQQYTWGNYYKRIFSWYSELGLIPFGS